MSEEIKQETEEQKNAREEVEAKLKGADATVEAYAEAGKFAIIAKDGANTHLRITDDGDVKADGENAKEVEYSLKHGDKLNADTDKVSDVKQRFIDYIKSRDDLPKEEQEKHINTVMEMSGADLEQRIEEMKAKTEAEKGGKDGQNNGSNELADVMDVGDKENNLGLKFSPVADTINEVGKFVKKSTIDPDVFKAWQAKQNSQAQRTNNGGGGIP